jgi:hypothetical protein
MKKSLAIALFLCASANAYAVDSGAVVGGAVGGAAGAVIGHSMGGQNGAILGAAIGGAAGAAVGSSNSAPAAQPAPVQAVSYREAEDGDGHRHRDNGLHRGERKKEYKKKHERHDD